MPRFLAILLLLACAAPAQAFERILAYDSEVEVHADGTLDVREHITVHADGYDIRRGIYRDFPTRYRDRHGNRVVVELDVVEVLRDGKAEPWFTEQIANGVRINTGNDDLLAVPARYTYTLHYRTSRQLGFFDAHDELYWNAIGTGWNFAIESGRVDVLLPQPVAPAQLNAEGYTGAQGSKGQGYVASVPAPGKAHWELTAPLQPREGLTIVLGFPKGIVTEPTRLQRVRWLLADNRGVLVALAGLVLLLGYCLRRWHAVGRDPARGVVYARYDPPPGYSPAELRYVRRMGHDNRCFSSDLLALAVAGYLRIERDKGLLKDAWTLTSLPRGGAGDGLSPSQSALLSHVFRPDRARLELDASNASTMQAAQVAQARALAKRLHGRMFKLNGSSLGWAIGILVVTGVAAFAASGGAGILAIVIVLALMLAAVIAFGFLVPARTIEGRRLLDEVEGLRLYLGVAERDELARLPGPGGPPELDARRYEQLLPYAVALDVEDAWTKKFTLAVGTAAAAAAGAGIAWYRGGGADNLGSLSKAIGGSLASQIASSSSPPGSSSGGGGGGSSGGGGGGGGGGGR